MMASAVERQTRFLTELQIDDLYVILIFLFSFGLPFFLQGFLRFFLESLFLVLALGHDFPPDFNRIERLRR
jgi:hypothetical protein